MESVDRRKCRKALGSEGCRDQISSSTAMDAALGVVRTALARSTPLAQGKGRAGDHARYTPSRNSRRLSAPRLRAAISIRSAVSRA